MTEENKKAQIVDVPWIVRNKTSVPVVRYEKDRLKFLPTHTILAKYTRVLQLYLST